jgi:hypothetical protein
MTTDTFQITGLNTIDFTTNKYNLQGEPTGMSRPLTKAQILQMIARLPEKIRGHVLKMGLSVISFEFDIIGSSGTDMEDAEHDLLETLQDTLLYFSTVGARGTKGQLQFKKDGASATSYKSIFYGELDEGTARAVLAAPLIDHKLLRMRLTLYCEPYWHPSSATQVVNAQNLYNHDDTDANHDNFVDIVAANILGDVPGPTLFFAQVPEYTTTPKWFYVARRTQGTPASFDHWLEAEDAGTQINWADLVDTSRSAGDIVSDGTAATTGKILHSLSNITHAKGRLGVYASLWADDITNSKFRTYVYFGDSARTYLSPWKYLGSASTWQLVNLGDLFIDPRMFPPGDTMYQIIVAVEYEKQANDTVKCDYVMLLPLDESTMFITTAHLPNYFNPGGDSIEIDGVRDFPFSYVVIAATGDFCNYAFVKGDWLTLQPGVDNRIYLKFLQATLYNDPYADHIDDIDNVDGANADHLIVSIWHLPYYISPLK